MRAEKTKAPRRPGASSSPNTRKPGTLADSPRLVTHRDVAEWFGVTTAGLRKWVNEGEFPKPHIVIARTWFYRADVIDHKLRTGTWLPGMKFNHVLGD